jgi:hypothetical protein
VPAVVDLAHFHWGLIPFRGVPCLPAPSV